MSLGKLEIGGIDRQRSMKLRTRNEGQSLEAGKRRLTVHAPAHEDRFSGVGM